MYLIRPAKKEDLPQIYKLAKATVAGGMTSLPQDMELLEAKIANSENAFSQEHTVPGGQIYLFVLEDKEKHAIGGISSIKAQVGVKQPLYFYQIREEGHPCSLIAGGFKEKLLFPVLCKDAPSEMCTLFLDRAYRSGGLGKLLSWSRFLFIANNPGRFSKTLMAMIRGVIKDDGYCIFWEEVGRRFIDIDYSALISEMQRNPALVKELILKYPLYLDLLSPEAQAVVGQPHPNSEAAYTLLQEQGFLLTDEIDPFDGGPKLEAPASEIGVVKESFVATVEALLDKIEAAPSLIANCSIANFRVILAPCTRIKGGGIAIEKRAAELLELNAGGKARVKQ